MLLVCLLLMGLMTGGYHPAATPLILASVKPEQRGKALGLHLIGGNSSFALAPLAAGPILALWGWRASFLLHGYSDRQISHDLLCLPHQTEAAGATSRQPEKDRFRQAPQPGYKAAPHRLPCTDGARRWGRHDAIFLSPLYGRRPRGIKCKGGHVHVFGVHSGFFRSPYRRLLSDRIGATKVVIATSLISGLVIFGINTFSLGLGFYAMLFIMGTNLAIRMPVTEVFIMSQTPAKHRSTIYGVYYFTMQYTGAIFAPIMGGLIQRYSFHTMFTFSAIAVTGISLVTSAFIWDAKA